MTFSINASQPRDLDGKYGHKPHGEGPSLEAEVAERAAHMAVAPMAAVRPGAAVRTNAYPEMWSRRCGQCDVIFTVEGDAVSGPGALNSRISLHTTYEHNAEASDERQVAAGEPVTGLQDAGTSTVLSPPVEPFADRVEHEGVTFYRTSSSVTPLQPYSMRLEFDRDLDESDIAHIAQLVGYQWRASVRGESIEQFEQDTTRSVVIHADSTKSRSDDIGVALDEFEESLDETLRDGSPVRKTDRAGVGTKGTRLVDGFEDFGRFELYYDSVTVR